MWQAPVAAVAPRRDRALTRPDHLGLAVADPAALGAVAARRAHTSGLPLTHRRAPLTRSSVRCRAARRARRGGSSKRCVGAGRSLAGSRQLPGESRRRSIAHRTSPTNIGLQLAGDTSAFDFGYLSLGRHPRSPRADVRHAAAHASATAVISTTGTTHGPSRRCRRRTSRRSTAAISPAISSRCDPA